MDQDQGPPISPTLAKVSYEFMKGIEETVITTYTFLVGAGLDKAIRDIAGSDDPRCAVAFLGRHAPVIFQGGHARIICNLASGATNPAAVRELQKHNHEVRQNSRLHSKVYLGGGWP
ncbi:hypothetical protein APT_01631 [Acetobacter pasteurianus NBRC 101655]|nr:hypothetical protein APT_01631 [Acetobacter pasteurianus NBRC 101655]